MDQEIAWTSREVWPLIVATGVFSALASFVLSGVADWIKAWWNKKKAARYTAMRCAVSLEGYATKCWGLFTMGEGEYSRFKDMTHMPMPEAPIFPDDVDWKSIDQPLADAALSFANGSSIAETHSNYANLWENNPFEFQQVAKKRGYGALKLASRIRNRYELGASSELDTLWRDLAPK